MSAGQTLGTARSDVVHPNRYGRALTWRSPGGLSPTTGDHRLAGQTTVQTGGANAYVATSGNAAGAFSLANGQQPWRIIRGDGDFQSVWLPGDGKVYFGGHFGQSIWSGAVKQNVVTASVVASVFISTGQIDTSWTPKIYTTYPGCWTFTSTPQKLWVGGDFTGEQVNGVNNHKPYLAAYPGI